jgi:glycolate oxidase iron-sulfur subunit
MGSSAFDEIRPPSGELIDDCVHCGFCLTTCPTYDLWNEEMDSPRGRIVLMRAGLEEGSEMSAELVTHIDQCLGCMACVTACPSGVQYDKLIEDTRAQVERNTDRSPADRLFRRFLFAIFTHPGRLRALAPLIATTRRLGLDRVAARSDALARLPRLRALAGLVPQTSLGSSLRPMQRTYAPSGTARARVALLQGCVQRVFFPGVNLATARVLAADGFHVTAAPTPRCCGALQLHTGYDREAAELAKQTIAALEGFDLIAVNAAGCGSAMKDYAHLLREDGAWAERATAFSAKVRDATEMLADGEPRAERHPVALRAAYHDACHLAHAQGVRAQPRQLLAQIPGLELVEPEEWELCCGSAGVYNLLQPEPAAELGRRKAANLLATGAEAVIAGNPGCALQISAQSELLGRRLPVYHPMELLAMSIGGGSS